MNLQELNELDFSNLGDWPAVVKIILILILCGLVGVGWYFLDIETQYEDLARVEKVNRTCVRILKSSRPRPPI